MRSLLLAAELLNVFRVTAEISRSGCDLLLGDSCARVSVFAPRKGEEGGENGEATKRVQRFHGEFPF